MVQHCLPAVPRSANIVTLSALCTIVPTSICEHVKHFCGNFPTGCARQGGCWAKTQRWLHCCQFCHIPVKVGYHGWETKLFSQIKIKLRFRLNIYSFYFFHSFLQDPPKMPARDLELRTLTAMTNPRAKQKTVQQTCEVMKWDEEIITWHDDW